MLRHAQRPVRLPAGSGDDGLYGFARVAAETGARVERRDVALDQGDDEADRTDGARDGQRQRDLINNNNNNTCVYLIVFTRRSEVYFLLYHVRYCSSTRTYSEAQFVMECISLVRPAPKDLFNVVQ